MTNFRSLSPTFLDRLRLNAGQAAALGRVRDFRGRQALWQHDVPDVLERLREFAVVESSESSNRIEGVTAPRPRIEALLKNATPRDRSEQEIAGYRDALAMIHDSHEAMNVTTGLVLQLHTTMYRYLNGEPSRWKPTDNDIVERHPDGTERVRFRAVPAVRTADEMATLVGTYTTACAQPGAEGLILAPLFVLDFLCIHPFADGNGRLSRLLTLLLLYQHDFFAGRYISLERIVEQSKETYYEALAKSSEGWHEGAHDPNPWLEYLWGVLVRAYSELEERVSAVRDFAGNKTERVTAAVRRRGEPFGIAEIEIECPDVSREHIRHVLQKLRDAGELTSPGPGRGGKWSKRSV